MITKTEISLAQLLEKNTCHLATDHIFKVFSCGL